MFVALKNRIQSNFLPERELKNSERGTVYLLREKGTGRRYVLHHFHGSAEVYDTLRGVECPNLPRVEDVAERDGQVLVLEEYIQGDTLAFLLEELPLKEEQAREILIQVCHGLKTLHALGVVHRDVKPENIILRGEEAVLIDFDASRVSKLERNTDTRIMGTTGYAAPEQFGFSQTDARADIFALGVLLNEMLTRQHPARQLANGSLRAVIEKCIEVNVDKRYASVEELLAALNASGAKEKGRRKWWLFLPLAVLAVILLVLPRLLPDVPPVADAEPQLSAELSAEPTPEMPQETPDEVQEEPSDVPLNRVLWHGDSKVYGTEFRYDLDEDGMEENYVFAAMFDFVGEPQLLQHGGASIEEKPEVMMVASAVWSKTAEGGYVPVDAFGTLLSDCEVAVRQEEGEHPCVVEEIGSLYGIWPGAIRATYEHVGIWFYECTAVLDGMELTAAGRTWISPGE